MRRKNAGEAKAAEAVRTLSIQSESGKQRIPPPPPPRRGEKPKSRMHPELHRTKSLKSHRNPTLYKKYELHFAEGGAAGVAVMQGLCNFILRNKISKIVKTSEI